MTGSDLLWLAVGWSVIALVDLLAVLVLVRIANGDIDLSRLLSEPTGDASLSRFQFLIFTYVVALALFLVTVRAGAFPEISGGILSLLGISASTYAVSKGIQFSSEEGVTERKPTIAIHPSTATVGPGMTQRFAVQVNRASQRTVAWSIDPEVGSIDDRGEYTAPEGIDEPSRVTVRAASLADPTVFDTAIVQLSPRSRH